MYFVIKNDFLSALDFFIMKLGILFIVVLIGSIQCSFARTAFNDDFDRPFDPLDENSFYEYSFTDLDNLVVTNTVEEGRLTITTNPYTTTVAQGETGALDHVKVLHYLREAYAPGHDKKVVRGTARIGATHYGLSSHPFPDDVVSDPEDDIRLGSCALNSIDLDTYVVADFFISNNGLWPYYERLPFGRTEENNYRAFSQTKRAADRKPADMHTLSVEYDATWGRISWLIDETVVMVANTIGHPIVGQGVKTIIDHGGVNEHVVPESFSYGFGCFTLLDGTDPNDPNQFEGLAMLYDGDGPSYTIPETFYEEEPDDEDRIWGQGSALTLGNFKVTQF